MDKYEQMARDILESTCETDEIFEDSDMDLLDAGYLDSFSLLNIIVEIEDKPGKDGPMLQRISSIISQNSCAHFVIYLIRDLTILLLLIYAMLLASGQEISFIYANF